MSLVPKFICCLGLVLLGAVGLGVEGRLAKRLALKIQAEEWE